MGARRVISTTLKLLVLVLLGIALYRISRPIPPPAAGMGDNDADDVKYTPIVPVGVAEISRATLHATIDAYGTVVAAPFVPGQPQAASAVGAPVASLVSSVRCAEGQHVEAGQILFTLDDRAAKAEVSAATSVQHSASDALEQVQKDFEASKASATQYLWAQFRLAAAEARLKLAEAALARLQVESPIAGTVVGLHIAPGQIVTPAAPAVEVADLDRLVIDASAPFSQVQKLKVGQTVEILPDDEGSNQSAVWAATQPTSRSVLRGLLTKIDPQADPSTGLATIDASIPAGSGLRLGQFLHIRIVSGEARDCLAVPVSSIVRDAEGRPGVSLVERDFHWAVRFPVQMGIREGNMVQVSNPQLREGAPIVASNADALPDNSRIEVTK